MNARLLTLTLVAVVGAVPAAADAEKSQRKGLFQRLTAEPALPAELQKDVDVFPMARTQTPRNPLSFAPFRVAKLRTGWRRENESSTGLGVLRGSMLTKASGGSRQNFSFTLEDDKRAEWNVSCAVRGSKRSLGYAGRTTSVQVDTSGEGTLKCDLSKPGSTTGATVELQGDVRSKGIGFDVAGDGRVIAGDGEYRINFLYILEDSRVLGDIPSGYLFLSDEIPVAALQSRAADGAPRRFTAARSLSQEKRSLLAAASAALSLHDRLTQDDW